jgi:DNA-binding Lrp family transcriptional regulator
MVQALILINVQRTYIPQTAQKLLEIEGVSEVYSVTGDYDLVALVRVAEYDDLAEVVTERLAAIETITKTQTMVAFKMYSRADLEQSWQIGVD